MRTKHEHGWVPLPVEVDRYRGAHLPQLTRIKQVSRRAPRIMASPNDISQVATFWSGILFPQSIRGSCLGIPAAAIGANRRRGNWRSRATLYIVYYQNLHSLTQQAGYRTRSTQNPARHANDGEEGDKGPLRRPVPRPIDNAVRWGDGIRAFFLLC